MRKNFTYLFTAFFFFTLNFLNGQTVVWPTDAASKKISEFDGGLNGWTTRGGTVDDNGNRFEDTKVKWTWRSNGRRLMTNSDGTIDSSFATTAGNGIALFDAFYVLDTILKSFEPTLFGEITSPNIDLSGKKDLTLTFSSYFSNFRTGTSVTWSEDGGSTWKDTISFQHFVKQRLNFGTFTSNGGDFNVGQYWDSYVDDEIKVKLNGSIGSSNFKVRFIFDGQAYFWFVDDVKLELYDNDMQLNRNFFAIAPNYGTPRNQIEPINFLADISNQGNKAQPNTKLRLNVLNLSTNSEVYSDTLNYGTVKQDTTIENKLMTKKFTPSSAANAFYRASYRIFSDSIDQYRFNDTAGVLFQTNDSTFRKDLGGFYPTRPSDRFWPTGNHNQRVGNYFYVVKGKSSTATSISVRLDLTTGTDTDLRGKTVSAYLIKWNQPKLPAVDSNVVRFKDQKIVAYGEVTIPTTAANNTSIRIPLINENPDVPGKNAYLEDNTPYLAVIEYNPTVASAAVGGNMEIYYDNRLEYSAMEYASILAGSPRRTTVFGGLTGATSFYVDNTNRATLMSVTPNDFAIDLFGTDVVPEIRLSVVPFRVNTNDILSDANKMEIYPNPTQNFVTLDFDLEKSTDVMIRIVNINGQIVLDKQYGVTKKERTELNVSHLPSGSYMMQILTVDGVKTKQFTIAK
jgi:Secretion system C-terminal sorting domain